MFVVVNAGTRAGAGFALANNIPAVLEGVGLGVEHPYSIVLVVVVSRK